MSLRANAKPIVRLQRANTLEPRVLLTVPKFANSVDLAADAATENDELPVEQHMEIALPEIDVRPWETVADQVLSEPADSPKPLQSETQQHGDRQSRPANADSLRSSCHVEATSEGEFVAESGDRSAQNQTRKSDPKQDSKAGHELESGFEPSFAVKTLNPAAWFSPDVRRNLGVVGSIAAAIVCCTVVARAMKNEHAKDTVLTAKSGDLNELVDSQLAETQDMSRPENLAIDNASRSRESARGSFQQAGSLHQTAIEQSIASRRTDGFAPASNGRFSNAQGFVGGISTAQVGPANVGGQQPASQVQTRGPQIAQFQRQAQPELPTAGQPFQQPSQMALQSAGGQPFNSQSAATPNGVNAAPSQEKINPFEMAAFGGGSERPIQSTNGSVSSSADSYRQGFAQNQGGANGGHAQGQPPQNVATFQAHDQRRAIQTAALQQRAEPSAGVRDSIQQYPSRDVPSLPPNTQSWQQTASANQDFQSQFGSSEAGTARSNNGESTSVDRVGEHRFQPNGAPQPAAMVQPNKASQPGVVPEAKPQGIQSDRTSTPALQINAPLLGRASAPELPTANSPKSVGGYPSTGGVTFSQLAAEIRGRATQGTNEQSGPVERMATRNGPTTNNARSFSSENLNTGVFR